MTHTDVRLLGYALLVLGAALTVSFGLATVLDWYTDLVDKAMKASKKNEQSTLDT
jgi:hypothetical protein